MHHHRFSYVVIALLLILDTSAASFAATVIYAQTLSGYIYKSTDSGKTWQATGTPTLPNATGVSSALAVDPQNTNNLYAMFLNQGIRGQVLPESGINRSTDGGQTWTGTVLANPAAPPLAVDATMSNIIYIVGNLDTAGTQSWRSTDYGQIGEHFAVEGAWTYQDGDFELSSGGIKTAFDASAQAAHADLLGYLRPRSSRWRPFVAAGAGAKFYTGSETPASRPLAQFGSFRQGTDSRPLLVFGGGMEWDDSPRWARARTQASTAGTRCKRMKV